MRIYNLPGKRFLPDGMQFSPDGRLLAVQAIGRVDVLDTGTGKVQPVYSVPYPGKVGTPGVGFTADSRGVIYFNDNTKSVLAFDLTSGQERVLRSSKKVHWSSRGDIEISTVQPDGGLVFLAVNPEPRSVEIVALDPVSGEQKFSFARQRSYVRELAVSADSRWVAGCTAIDLRVWDIGGGRLPNRASWHVQDRKSSCFGNLAMARDGAYLAAGTYGCRGPVRVWDLKAGTEPVLATSVAGGGGVAFAPDRPLLAFTGQTRDVGEVVFWDAQARAERKRFDWGLGPVGAIAFSPDGCRCATASSTRAVVWDVDV
jgi:WD40 repeat protein